jgi:hypothetical protein
MLCYKERKRVYDLEFPGPGSQHEAPGSGFLGTESETNTSSILYTLTGALLKFLRGAPGRRFRLCEPIRSTLGNHRKLLDSDEIRSDLTGIIVVENRSDPTRFLWKPHPIHPKL